MERREIKVIYRERAIKSIRNFGIYIEEKGFPETAEKFVKVLMSFGNSLNVLPEKYSICRNPSFAKRKYRCAVFKKKYIFIYKVVKNELIIFNVVYGSRFNY